MNKLLIIGGPTAMGKTELAIELAREFAGEIVSADSRQIYRYLDIGTSKQLPRDSRLETRKRKLGIEDKKYEVGFHTIDEVRVWLYDVIKSDQRFSAVEYAELAWTVIENIWQRNKLPIMVGGTGFYIKAVLEGIDTAGVEPDWELREKLNNLTTKQIINRLNMLEPERWEKMNKSDRNNPRRLIRAIELVLQNQKLKTNPKPEQVRFWARNQKHPEGEQVPFRAGKSKVKKLDPLLIGLTAENEILYEIIDRRVEERVRQGIVEEIKSLLEKGYSWDDPGFNALGYKEWRAYFSGLASKGEVIQRWKYDEHGYARRQLTWFRKDKKTRWFDITEDDYKRKVEEIVKKWYYS